MTPDQEYERGERAKALWDNDIFKEARTSVRNAIVDKWATSPVGDKEGQHELRLMLKLLDDLEANILRVIQDGKHAEEIIKRNASEKVRRFVRGYL
jgi:hypothetical protein